MMMGLRLAEVIAHAAILHAEIVGIRVSVAVCDHNGRIVTFLKMDGTDAMSGHEAMRRAMTAAGAGVPSELIGEGRNTSTSVSMEGIGLSHRPGGLPLMIDRKCVGGIGICGGTALQAIECARAAITAADTVDATG